jgi:DNA-binding PadR family transcriptional regulator
MDANMKRDILRRIILELLSNGDVHYTDLDKKVCTTGYPFATSHTFRSQFYYLLKNGYVTKISRGIYRITPKGQKYLEVFIL